MTDDELSKLALLTSPEIVRDNHAFAAMVARHCGTAGPVAVQETVAPAMTAHNDNDAASKPSHWTAEEIDQALMFVAALRCQRFGQVIDNLAARFRVSRRDAISLYRATQSEGA